MLFEFILVCAVSQKSLYCDNDNTTLLQVLFDQTLVKIEECISVSNKEQFFGVLHLLAYQNSNLTFSTLNSLLIGLVFLVCIVTNDEFTKRLP